MQESDLQRASKILRTEFGSDWKQIVRDIGDKRTYALCRTRFDFFYGISRTGRRWQQ